MLWGSWFYFNCSVENSENQEPVKCRDAAKHFLTSPIWNEFLNVMKEILRALQEHGFRECWKQLIGALDATGEANALKVSIQNHTQNNLLLNDFEGSKNTIIYFYTYG